MATEIIQFYGNQIPCFQENSRIFVGVKAICEKISIEFANQSDKIKSDEILKDEWAEHPIQDTIGREQKSLFLPLEFIQGWLFQVKITNTMSDETKQILLQYKRECYKVLFNHFNKTIAKQLEANAIEIKLLEEINELNEQKNVITSEMRAKKQKLEKVRQSRLNNLPTLF